MYSIDVNGKYKAIAIRHGFLLVIASYAPQRDGRHDFYLRCDRQVPKSPRDFSGAVRLNTKRKGVGCKFVIKAKRKDRSGFFIDIKAGEHGKHNHKLVVYLEGHRQISELSLEAKQLVREMSDAQTKPSLIVVALQQKFPADNPTVRHVYNYRENIRQERLDGHTWIVHKEKLVRAWMNKVLHFGNMTNCRVESAHASLKEGIWSSTSSLDTLFTRIEKLFELLLEEDKRQQGLSSDFAVRCGCALLSGEMETDVFPYKHLLPAIILDTIVAWNDVVGDGNCGFQIEWGGDTCTEAHYMEVPSDLWAVANLYKCAMMLFGLIGSRRFLMPCVTVLPWKVDMTINQPLPELVIVHLGEYKHYIRLEMQHDFPVPPIIDRWFQIRTPSVHGFDHAYTCRREAWDERV
ncbi:hypothetical protein RDABS01_038946 [Bienertia sinuspersici]